MLHQTIDENRINDIPFLIIKVKRSDGGKI